MPSQTHNGIYIEVHSKYVNEYSNPVQGMHYFTYTIEIVNNNPFNVQLITRHWVITDCADRLKEVIGEGVVGKQPILEPGESFSYSSACDFKSGIGRMSGQYTFKNLKTNTNFKVNIPSFINEAGYLLN